MINFKTQLIRAILFLIGIVVSQSVAAANVLKIGTYSVDPFTEFTVQIEADNTDPFVAFQADIPLPAGFIYKEGSAILNSARISGHALSASLLAGNILRLIGYSVSNTAFTGTSGTIASFILKAGTTPATYPLIFQNPVLGDAQSSNILIGSINGSVTILAPNIKLSASELNYDRVALASNSTIGIQISNDGNRDLTITSLNLNETQFSVTEVTPFTITAGNSRFISVKFAPTVKGTYNKQLQIVSNDPDQPTASIALNAVAYAVNELHTGNMTGASSSTEKLDFTLNNMEEFTGIQFDINLPQPMTYISGTAQLFRSTDHTVSVNQLNAQTLRVLAFSSGNQSFTGNSGKVLSLDFALKGVANWYSINISNVIIANSSGENILSESFYGFLQITAPDIDTQQQLSFGDVSILSDSTKLHRIYNYGQQPLTITQLLFNSDYFRSNQTLPLTIQAYQYIDLPVEFVKTIKGQASGTLKIVSDDPDENPITVQLSGNAFTPNYLSISAQVLTQGESKSVAIEVDNEEPFVAVQFDLTYPEGFTPDLSTIALTERKQDHAVSAVALTATSMRVLIYSLGQKTFTGKTGAILNIPFIAASNMQPGNYNLTFSNAMLSNSNSENILYAAKDGILTIKKDNYQPIANAGSDQTVNEASIVTLDGSGSTDADGDALTYLWTAPEGITLSSNTAQKPTFVAPLVNYSVDYQFSLIVNDGKLNSDPKIVNIKVNNIEFAYHFKKVWSGNGFDHMNIYAVQFKLDGVDLEDGDEIGVFDGNLCVGVGNLSERKWSLGNVSILVSARNVAGDGYVTDHPISYKFYDKSEDKEIDICSTSYVNDHPLWDTDGKFTPGASAFVRLNCTTPKLQSIEFTNGWNIISANVIPSNLDMKTIFQPLIDDGKLKKVMDEAGKAIENFGTLGGGWKNNIGNLNNSKGYKVNVTSASTLTLEGAPVQLPMDIALTTGWNIISYPSTTPQDAKALFQSLIDAGKLKKVMDEAGKTMENFGLIGGGWKNNIGNFLPGKGYKVNVTDDCMLTIPADGTKSATIVPELLASAHFKTVFSGNGNDHMNIHLVDLQNSGLQAGDEIGVLDGELCVGAAMVGVEQLIDGTISIAASANDGPGEMMNGFAESHPVELRLYREGETTTLQFEKREGNGLFEKNGSLFMSINNDYLADIQMKITGANIQCYPNPFSKEITIQVLNSNQNELTVEIFNMTGQLIKKMYKGTNNGNLILKWNGTNDSGLSVVSGMYLCRANGKSKSIFLNK